MSEGVQFDEDTRSYGGVNRPAASGGFGSTTPEGSSGMERWLLAHGWAKTPRAAQSIMIGVIVVDIIIIAVVLKFFL